MAKRTSHLFPVLPSANIFRRGREGFLRTRPLTSYAPRIELSPPPQVQAHLGGRNFASCVALGRNFSATFRKAPPAHAQLRPLRPEAEEWSRARAGGGSKGYAEIHTQGDARREASPWWGVCQQLRTKKSTRFCKIVASSVLFVCPGLALCISSQLPSWLDS